MFSTEEFIVRKLLNLIDQRQKGRLFVHDADVQVACRELRRHEPTRPYRADEFLETLRSKNFLNHEKA